MVWMFSLEHFICCHSNASMFQNPTLAVLKPPTHLSQAMPRDWHKRSKHVSPKRLIWRKKMTHRKGQDNSGRRCSHLYGCCYSKWDVREFLSVRIAIFLTDHDCPIFFWIISCITAHQLQEKNAGIFGTTSSTTANKLISKLKHAQMLFYFRTISYPHLPK